MSVYYTFYVGDCFGDCLDRCMKEIAPGMYSYVDNTGLCWSYYLHCRERCRRYCYDP